MQATSVFLAGHLKRVDDRQLQSLHPVNQIVASQARKR
jgi:hypothetical protein